MLTIRPAQLTDCNELVLLCHELGYDTSAEALARRLAELQAHPDHAVFVADFATDIMPDAAQAASLQRSFSHIVVGGWVHVHLHFTLQEGREAEIGGLVVAKKFRGRGAGKQLMQQAEAWAQQQGCYTMMVRSNVQRSDAHQFYQRVGYREIKRSVVFRQLFFPAAHSFHAQS